MSAPTSWAWTGYAANGTTVLWTSTLQNPSFTYPAAGSYFVNLTATNAAGSNTIQKAVAVVAPGAFTPKSSTRSVTGTATTRVVTVPAIAVGDLLLVNTSSSEAPASCADSVGNTYVARAAAQAFPGAGWFDRNFKSTATVAGTNVVVTVTLPAPVTYGGITVSVFSYTQTLTDLGHSEGSGAAIGGPMDSGTIPASVGNVLFVGTHDYNATAPAPPTGWTALGGQHAILQSATPVAGRYQPTYAGVQSWISQLDVFAANAPVANAPPTITITTPTANPTHAVTTTPLTIGGTAADDVSVAIVTWSNNRGGNGTATGPTTAWTVTGIVLQPGVNVLTVTAQDGAGLTATDVLTVTYTPPDTTAPGCTITGPTAAATYATSQPSVALSGTATDAVAVTGVTWTNDRGGSGAASFSGTTSVTWSIASVALQSGANVLTVTATDAAGNLGTDVLTVTYTPIVVGPGLPPDLMRGFGTVRGIATTDTIQTPLSAQSAQRSWLFWARREQTPLPRTVFTKSTQAIQSLAERFIASVDGGLASRHFQRQFTDGTADWGYYTSAPVGTRFHVAIAYDSGSPANVPTIWVNGVVQSLFTIRQPIGGATPVNNAAGYMLGNYPGGGGDWGGDLAKWTVYNRLVSQQDVIDHYNGTNPMAIGVAPVAYHVLDGASGTEPDAVTAGASVVTGTLQQNYGAPGPPTVTLAVTSGNPAVFGSLYQITGFTTGVVNRVEFYVATPAGGTLVLTRTVTVAPYTLFAAPTTLGAGTHTIEARVYADPGATPTDTDTLPITEPSASSNTWTNTYEVDRVTGADSYNFYVDGSFHQNKVQPAIGNPNFTVSFTGADTLKLFEVTSVTGGVESARSGASKQYTDTSATPVDGFKEIARPYTVATTTWQPTYRWNRKTLALSYNVYLDGSLAGNVLQPAGTVLPTFVASFTDTGASVEKTIGVEAVFAGAVVGPRSGARIQYTAPAANAPTGFQELTRTFTP